MKAFLIEDEPAARIRFTELLKEVTPVVELVGEADSIVTAIQWLENNPSPDVIFSDIQLADGLCFSVFEKHKPSCPVVFITAYDNYALQAFKTNAIDYILKPLKKEDLRMVIAKIEKTGKQKLGDINYETLASAILKEEKKYDRRYLIRFSDQIRSVESDDIAYIYTTQKAVFMVLFSGKSLPFDKSLDALEKELDPAKFFRINRQFIVNVKSIKLMQTVSKSRVQLQLNPPYNEDEVIVSTEKSPLFKTWLGDE